MAQREIVVPPNDRLIRAILLTIGLVWWSSEGLELIRRAPAAMLVFFLPLWMIVAVAAVLLLLWIAGGRFVFTVENGTLRIERRIGAIKVFGSRVYSVASIRNLRVEQRVTKIKGNKSTRYAVLFDGIAGDEELAWYRDQSGAEAFVGQLRESAIDTRPSPPIPAR